MFGRITGYFAIGLISAAIAILNAFFNPNAPAWDPEVVQEGEISVESARNITGAFFVDARSSRDFQSDHIPGAYLLNEDDWDNLLFTFLDSWDADSAIVVYCSSLECQASHAVAERLKAELGFEEIYVLKGGWEAWIGEEIF